MGDTANILGLLATGTSAVSSVSSAYGQSQAIKAQAGHDSRMANVDASMSRMQADDAKRRGEIAASQQGVQTRRLIGAQRAAAAANGVGVDTGSSADLQAESAALGAMDALTIRNNAFLEAQGHKGNALRESSASRWIRMQGKSRANDTLLTGGLRAFRTASYGLSNYYPKSKGAGANPGLGEEDPMNP